MENKELFDLIVDTIARNEHQALKRAQRIFARQHYNNASLIGCKGVTNLMGKSYSMPLDEFEALVKSISSVSEKGAELIFDYSLKHTYHQVERLMSRCGYLIYEHLSDKEMQELGAPAGFHFVLAVKKEHLK